MGVEPTTDSSDKSGEPGSQNFEANDVQTLHLGEQCVFTQHAEDGAKTGTLQHKEQRKDDGQDAIDDDHILGARDVVLIDPTNVAKALRPVRPY